MFKKLNIFKFINNNTEYKYTKIVYSIIRKNKFQLSLLPSLQPVHFKGRLKESSIYIIPKIFFFRYPFQIS